MLSFKRNYGFTIVELLIVIVVIGILATLTIVGYNNFTQRALNATMASDLKGAADQVELARTNANTRAYPTSLPSGVKTSDNVVLQMAATSDTTSYCINAYNTRNPSIRMSWNSTEKEPKPYLCAGLPTGSVAGGTVPTAPRGVNLMPDLSTWELANGATYNATTKEVTFTTATSSAKSPPVRIDSSVTVTAGIDVYAAASAPSFTPNGGLLWGSAYYGADGITPVKNSPGVGYTSNGNAQMAPLATWQTRTWGIATGPDVKYIRMSISTSTSNYNGLGNKYRNPTLIAND